MIIGSGRFIYHGCLNRRNRIHDRKYDNIGDKHAITRLCTLFFSFFSFFFFVNHKGKVNQPIPVLGTPSIDDRIDIINLSKFNSICKCTVGCNLHPGDKYIFYVCAMLKVLIIHAKICKSIQSVTIYLFIFQASFHFRCRWIIWYWTRNNCSRYNFTWEMSNNKIYR